MKTVLLCDYGLDDACATLKVLQERKETDEIIIVAVAGNDSAQKSLDNAKKLISNVENRCGITIVDTTDIKQNCAYLPSIHGNDSMGDLLEQKDVPLKVIKFADWIKTTDNDMLLISLGPCAITKLIIEKIGEPKTLLIMGGNVNEEPNFNDYEFNHGIDVEAFAWCVKHPHLIATLDSCRCEKYNFISRKFDENTLLGKMLNKSISLAKLRHPDRSFVYDYICVSYLYEKEKWSTKVMTDSDKNQLNVLFYNC